MLVLKSSGLMKWTGLRNSCRYTLSYLVCGIATDLTVLIFIETVSPASQT